MRYGCSALLHLGEEDAAAATKPYLVKSRCKYICKYRCEQLRGGIRAGAPAVPSLHRCPLTREESAC